MVRVAPWIFGVLIVGLNVFCPPFDGNWTAELSSWQPV